MVAAVVGHHDILQSVALGNADGNGKHDAVAERHHRRFHVLVGIVTFRDSFRTIQQRTLEILRHKVQGDDDVTDAQTLTVQAGKGNFAGIMVTAVVERDSQRYALLLFI